MNELKVFEHTEFGGLHVLIVDGVEYFPATACAKKLGYAEPEKAIRMHCKGVSKMDTPSAGGNQKVNYITEPNLFRLILKSKLPAAERFERWVMETVLPEIRRKGAYNSHTENIPLDKVLEIVQLTATTMASEFVKQVVPLIRQQPAAPPPAEPSIDNNDVDVIQTTTIIREVTRKRRSNGKVARLPAELRSEVETMLADGLSYREITEYLAEQGHHMSQMAICTYMKKLKEGR